jgi:uncharacterized protein (TIGR04255 family)
MKTIDPSKIKYPRNFIKRVIFRIDYNSILSLNESLKSEFQESIRPLFPKFQSQPGQQVVTEFKDGSATSNSIPFNQYIFENTDSSQKLTLSSQFLIMEILKFEGFESLKEVIEKITTSFNSIYRPINLTRLGLRYINEIPLATGSPYDWDGYINQDLVRILSSDLIIKEETARVMSQIIYNKEDYKITFSFGLSNSEYPNRISRREFILDYDCSTNEADFTNLIDTISNYNGNMVVLFENSIEDKLRERLRGNDNV